MIEQWYLGNIQMLWQVWPVEYDDGAFTWIKISHFDLPPVYYKDNSTLLFLTPGYNIQNFEDYHFFVDRDLMRQDGIDPPFVHENHECNSLYRYGYARLSFHLKSFRPTTDVVSGDNYLKLAKAVYHFLGQEEVYENEDNI